MSRVTRTSPDVDAVGLGAYLREISQFRPLSPSEERRVILKMRCGDRAAFQTLVECNLRFVVSQARRYTGSGYPIEELIHEGNLGLIEAARRFDPDRDVRFLTYAGWWVRQAILAAIAHLGRAVSMPPRLIYEAYRFELHLRDMAQELGRHPYVEEITERLGIGEADVRTLMEASPRDVSLNTPLGENALLDAIEDTDLLAADGYLMAGVFSRELEELLDQLDTRERFVVESRFGLAGLEPQTLRELGGALGLSIERVRQIEARALERLRRSRRAQRLRGYLN